jgi:mRNA interferase MazF
LRGEIWDVDLNPTIGVEINKIRPVVVISSNALRSLPLRLVAPITGWKESFTGKYSHVKIEPNPFNGLTKSSAVDSLQLRGIALDRFLSKRGELTATEIEEIVCAVAAVIEYG